MVCLKALASLYMLHTFKIFIRRLEKFLVLFKVKTSLKNEGFWRATQTSRFRNVGVSLKKLLILYVCFIKKCFWGRMIMKVNEFDSAGFNIHATYSRKFRIHTTSRRFYTRPWSSESPKFFRHKWIILSTNFYCSQRNFNLAVVYFHWSKIVFTI